METAIIILAADIQDPIIELSEAQEAFIAALLAKSSEALVNL